MDIKSLSNHALAVYIAEHTDRDSIIAEVFRLLRLNCLERCTLDPTNLDTRIRTFENTPDCDVELLTEIIAILRSGQEADQKKENIVRAENSKQLPANVFLLFYCFPTIDFESPEQYNGIK